MFIWWLIFFFRKESVCGQWSVWPVCSPDMKLIEHIWKILILWVAGRLPFSKILQKLERTLSNEWDRILQRLIYSFIDSMPQRCSTLLGIREPTSYCKTISFKEKNHSCITCTRIVFFFLLYPIAQYNAFLLTKHMRFFFRIPITSGDHVSVIKTIPKRQYPSTNSI